MNEATSRMGRRLRVLQVGAGAMGTRRMRDLSDQDAIELGLFDLSEGRRHAASERFDVQVFDRFDDGVAWRPDALIISTPPDAHQAYVVAALELGIHHFCEENIWTYDHEFVERTSLQRGIISAPSCSFHFLPLVREIRRVVHEELGELHAYQMLLSTFMPNWHPDDGSEFYARQRSTAAAREMTPFELVWLNWVFGDPTHASGSVTKAGSLPERSEDTWVVHMDLDHGAGQLVVGHASPTDHRSGRAIGSNGLISFDIFAGTIDRDLPTLGLVDHRYVGAQSDDLEQAYADEIATFIDTIHGDAVWPHSYRASSIATATLAACETSASTGQRVIVDTGKQPGTVPPNSPNRSSRLGVDGRFGDLDNDGELAAELPLED